MLKHQDVIVRADLQLTEKENAGRFVAANFSPHNGNLKCGAAICHLVVAIYYTTVMLIY